MTTTVSFDELSRLTARPRPPGRAEELRTIGRPPSKARRAAFSAARRHSRVVWVLRILMPFAAIAALSSYALFANFGFSSGNLTATIAGLQLQNDRLTMVKPLLEGATRSGGTYAVRAEKAIQNITTPNVIELDTITARLTELDGSWTTMNSAAGTFQSKLQTLDLRDGVRLLTHDGRTGQLEDAAVDMKAQTVVTDRPVRFEMLNGNVVADSMTMDVKPRTIAFVGRVRVTILKIPAKTPQKQLRTTTGAAE